MSRKSPDSPDSFLGYANQIYRGLFYLITKRETVCIEKNDDVFVEDSYGFLFLEQVKDKNASVFRASSSDFLDTFVHWVGLYINNKAKFNPRTKCVLALLQKNNTDSLIIACEMAKNKTDCEDVYLKLLTKVKDKPSYRDVFENNKVAVIEIIKRFEIYKPTVDVKSDLEHTIAEWLKDLIVTEKVKNHTDQLIGWFFKAAVNSENKELRLISIAYHDFIKKILQLNGETIGITYPSKEQIIKEPNEYLRTYVKQLNLINMDEVVDAAITDCLSWEYLLENDFKDGRITQPEMNNSYSRLCNRWKENKLLLSCTLSDIALGKALYLKSIEEKVTVSGVSIYGDDKCISRGAHNYLADNTDEYEIGWHPNFKELLDEK